MTNFKCKFLSRFWHEKSLFRKILFLTVSLSALLTLILTIYICFLLAAAPELDLTAVSPNGSATYILDQNGIPLRKLTLADTNRDIVELQQIAPDLQHAVIAIEDERFYEHHGIDLPGIARAFTTGIAKGSFSEGASTITQQLIKNTLFTNWTQEHSFSDRLRRKIQEQYLALKLEKQLSKDEILENYLNIINFGSGCYGVQAASRRYFGKNASELSLSESAVIAAIPQNPSGLNPIHYPEKNRIRQRTILRYMLEQDYITKEAYQSALADNVYQRISVSDEISSNTTVYSWYEDALIEQVAQNLQTTFGCTYEQAHHAVYSGGLRIYSAQDQALQQICDEEFSNPANYPEDILTLSPQPQASLVLIEQKTGLVRALVGGRGEKTASLTLNRAAGTLRQPGSTFKILTAYAPALDACGQTLATVYENKPFAYADGTPVSNWDVSDYSGTVTIREAITRSVNTAAVRCITDITPQVGFSYAKKFGITTLHETYEANGAISSDIIQPLALGGITEGVTNLELCGAYAAIANQGLYIQPRLFTQVLDRHGNILIDIAPSARVLQESTAYLLTSAMQDVVSSPDGTAFGSISAAGHPVAGKTGTTSNYKDIWFTGYTPYYTCSVWGGYDNNEDLPDYSTYHSYNKHLWSSVMNRIHSNLSYTDFNCPDNIVMVTLCKQTHNLATPYCSDPYTEYFADGTQPAGTCTFHQPPPETEPIIIYQDLLDQLLTETESEHESEILSETISESESESEIPSETMPESEIESEIPSETMSESESGSEILSETITESKSESTIPSEIISEWESEATDSLDAFWKQLNTISQN